MFKFRDVHHFMRVMHRYLGFFMAGIMVVYSVSGILLVYRDTDFMKTKTHIHKNIGKGIIEEQDLGRLLKQKRFKIEKKEGSVYFFKEGTYDEKTGIADYVDKKYPLMLDKFVALHKSRSKDRLSLLNVFFGVSLFFFVFSSFWMFRPSVKLFRRSMVYFILGLFFSILLVIYFY